MIGGKPLVNDRLTLADVPSLSEESLALSKLLKQHGFRFIGPTTCYAFMQAVGMVDDHETACFRHSRRRARVAARR